MKMPHQFRDSDLTMVVEKLFDDILLMIKNSKLNFQLQLSPYSAHISIKESFQKDRTGQLQVPSLESRDVMQLKHQHKQYKFKIEDIKMHEKNYN